MRIPTFPPLRLPFRRSPVQGVRYASVAMVVAVALAAAPSSDGAALSVGQTSAEKASSIRLGSFGKPEQKGGRWCRNSDETGVGDNRAGYASVDVPMAIKPGLYEFRMDVWGQSDRFSFVAYNGERYRTIGWGKPSGRPQWETIRFVLRPSDLDMKGKKQRFGFGSKDRQVWVSRVEFRVLGASKTDLAALEAARRRAADGEIVVAAGGATDFTIVIGDGDGKVLRYAAAELQKSILMMTRGYLPIAVLSGKAAAIGKQRRVVLSVFSQGSTELTSPDGFYVIARNGRIEIVGMSPLGTLFGTYAFLERLGCRWIRPGPDGEVVPKRDPLIVPRLTMSEEPDFKIRWVGRGDWALKNRCNVNSTVDGERVGYVWKWSYHSFYGLLPPKDYWDTHPEYYPLVGRGRRRPEGYSNTQLCTTNPEAIRLIGQNIIRIFRDDPRIDIVALCPNDGGGFCTCPQCALLDRSKPDFWGRYSDRLAPFNNAVARQVARVFPQKLLKTGAYAQYMRYPIAPGYKPEPNMAVQACHTYSCNNHAIDSDCPRNKAYFREPLEKWAKRAKHLWIYEYYIKGAWAGLLYTQTHIMARDIAYYRRIGAEGFYTQWSTGAFRSVGLDFYVAARLLWDTDADVDAIMRDYCHAFFGDDAGPAMYRFYKALGQAFVDSKDCISPFGYKRVWLAAPQVFTPNALAELERHMADAERLAPNDLVKRRLEPTRVTFEYTKRTMRYLRAVSACFDRVESPDAPGFAAAAARAREVGARESAKVVAYLKAHGLGSLVRSPRSKAAQMLKVHLNPRVAVLRWWKPRHAGPVKALPPIPGSRLVGRMAARARVRLDRKDEGVGQRWFAENFDDSSWKEIPFPCYWQDAGLAEVGYRGAGWYRTAFTVPPKSLPKGTRLMLRFEGVDAAARVYVNGRLAGEHKFAPGRSWQQPFELDVTNCAKTGKNSLAIRVFTGGGKGGVYGRVISYRLGDEPEDFMR